MHTLVHVNVQVAVSKTAAAGALWDAGMAGGPCSLQVNPKRASGRGRMAACRLQVGWLYDPFTPSLIFSTVIVLGHTDVTSSLPLFGTDVGRRLPSRCTGCGSLYESMSHT